MGGGNREFARRDEVFGIFAPSPRRCTSWCADETVREQAEILRGGLSGLHDGELRWRRRRRWSRRTAARAGGLGPARGQGILDAACASERDPSPTQSAKRERLYSPPRRSLLFLGGSLVKHLHLDLKGWGVGLGITPSQAAGRRSPPPPAWSHRSLRHGAMRPCRPCPPLPPSSSDLHPSPWPSST